MNESLLLRFLASVENQEVTSVHLTKEQTIMRNYCDSQGLIWLSTEKPGLPVYCLTEAGESMLLALRKEAEESSKKEADERAQKDSEKREAERLRVKDARRSWWQFGFLSRSSFFSVWHLSFILPLFHEASERFPAFRGDEGLHSGPV